MDTNANYHLTSNMNVLISHMPYGGSKEMMLGNGSIVFIAHYGERLLPTQITLLKLHHVLHVPMLAENFILSRECVQTII